MRRVLANRTFVTIGSFFLPFSHVVCAGGSWGQTIRRSVPSWVQGGRLALGRGEPASPPGVQRQSPRRPPSRRAAAPRPPESGPGQRRGRATPRGGRGAGQASSPVRDSRCSGTKSRTMPPFTCTRTKPLPVYCSRPVPGLPRRAGRSRAAQPAVHGCAGPGWCRGRAAHAASAPRLSDGFRPAV